METSFHIALYIKTHQGFEQFARYHVGNKDKLARELFAKLKGTTEDPQNCILQMDLIETRDSLPFNINLIGCTLQQIAENCKVITKEVFKIFALESG